MANYDQKGQNTHTQINADTVNLHINSNDSANQQSKPTYTNGFKIRVYLTINKIIGDRNNKYELYIDNQVVWSEELKSYNGLISVQQLQKGFHKLVFHNDTHLIRLTQHHPDTMKTFDLTSDFDIYINVNKSWLDGSESTVITVKDANT